MRYEKVATKNVMTFLKYIYSISLIIISVPLSAIGQGTAAYTDYRGAFQIFDNGIIQQLEYLPVKSFQTGGNSVAYIDNTGEFRIYYNGRKYHQLYASDQFSYFVSNHLTV